jgi:hypothetical protein
MEELQGYARSTITYAEDLAPLFGETIEAPRLKPPDPPAADAPKHLQDQYKYQWKRYGKHYDQLEDVSLPTLFNAGWKQCTPAMKVRLKALDGYRTASQTTDCVWLFTNIRSIMLQFDATKKIGLSLLDARFNFLNCSQHASESVESYVENLRGWAEAIECYGGHIAEYIFCDRDYPDAVPDLDGYDRAREETLALAIIRNADGACFGSLRNELANAFLLGQDKYPKDSTAAYNLLVNYRPLISPKPPQQQNRNTNQSQATHKSTAPPTTSPTPASAPNEVNGITFAQVGTVVPGTNGEVFAHITCSKCKQPGHFANRCPNGQTTVSGTTLMQHGFVLAHSSTGDGIDPNWILLDSQSTLSVFRNASMLSNIRPSDQVLRAITNGGSQTSHLVGDFPNLGPVWYNPESIANILSLAKVRRVCRVTMDTSESPAFVVHRLDGSEMRFEEADSGLYVFSPNDSTAVKMYTLLQTVAGQKKLWNKRQIEAADEARHIYRIAGRPSEEDFEWYLRKNFIRNSPVTPDNAKRALAIYGPDVATLKGKTRCGADAPRVPSFKAVPIPPPILLHHRDVTLCTDFLFVQGIPFFHTISRNIGYRTLTAVPDRSKKTILRETQRAINLYNTRGFTVHGMHCDNEFGCIKDDVLPVRLDIVPADSHVGEVERSIRTIRERTRSAVHGMPYKGLPKLMVIELVKEAVRCLNLFPRRDGISDTMSPNTIVTGEGLPDYNKMTLEFGEYVQIFEPTTPSNTLHSRTLGAIALGPSGNANSPPALALPAINGSALVVFPTPPSTGCTPLLLRKINHSFKSLVLFSNGTLICPSTTMNTTKTICPPSPPVPLTMTWTTVFFLLMMMNSISLRLLLVSHLLLEWTKERAWSRKLKSPLCPNPLQT